MTSRVHGRPTSAAQRPSVAALLNPRNVVLVGASERPGHWSARVRRNLTRYGFPGSVFAVNPRGEPIWGEPSYRDLGALPEPPDHLATFTPPDVTLDILEAGARLGARSATVFAAGFGEAAESVGVERALRLQDLAARTGMAVAGPNCMGLASGASRFVTVADENLEILKPGPVAILTQSGMLCSTLARALSDRGLGVGHVVSCGNQVVLTFADYIDYLSGEGRARVILCYIEGLPDAGRFFEVCDRASRRGVTVVTVKIGGSRAGREAALAHTGAMAGNAAVFRTLAQRAGIVHASSLEEAIEAVAFAHHAPLPRGARGAFVTHSGAMTSLMAEEAEASGLQMAAIAPTTASRLAGLLGDGVRIANPLDTRATLPGDMLGDCVEALRRDPGVDFVVVTEEPPRVAGVTRKIAIFDALDALAARQAPELAPVTVLSPVALADSDYSRSLRANLAHLPMLRDLGKSFRALRSLSEAGAVVAQARPDAPPWRPRRRASGHGAEAAAAGRQRVLDEVQSKALLAAHGLPAPVEVVVRSPEDAAAEAARIGYPVVVKGVCGSLAHKSDAGLVELGCHDAAAVRAAADRIAAAADRAGARLDGLLVAEQVTGGIEAAVGLHDDPECGTVVMVGLGGVWLELMADIAFAPCDLDMATAVAAIGRTRLGRLLAGYRNRPPGDIEALAQAMVALGRLAMSDHSIVSVDINPLLVREPGQGVVVLDALVVTET